jgi:AcrR family transcriptional regulator
MPRLSADQQAARRMRLLDAAERCVARSGFHAATMAEIARAARVSAGAAYIYFRSKEDLIAGIAARDRERLAADFAAIAEAPDFADALEACARAHLIDGPAASRNPAVARSHRGVDQVVQAAFRAALERQIAAGRIAPAIGLDALVNVLRLLGDGLFHRRAVEPDADPEALLAAAMDLVRRILVPAQASVTPRRRRRRP